jgi:serine protease Do
MAGVAKRWLAASAVLGLAATFVGVGVTLSIAQEQKTPDLSDLRDAVRAASKRGNNVDEVAKAVDALEKRLAKGFTPPKPGEAPPAELLALRGAVEAAGAKGENVEGIRAELEKVEKAITGKTLAPPKPLPPPVDPPPFRPMPGNPFDRPFPIPQPVFPNGGGVDRELLEKAQALRTKAFEMLLKNPNDADAMKLVQEAQELMLKAIANGRGGLMLPDLMVPNPGIGRVADRFRLGVRMERLAAITAEQLGLEGRGIAVTAVIPGSAADKAGLKVHDIVLEFAGKAVSDVPEEFTRQVNDAKAGEKVDIVVLRKGKKVELKGVELPEQPRVANPRLPDFKPAFPNPLLPDGGLQLPDAKPIPFPNPFDNIRPQVGPNGCVNSFSVSNTNGQLTIKAMQDGVAYLITGTKGNDGLAVDKVTITDGDKKPVEVASLKDVPKEYQPAVEQFIKKAEARPTTRR